MRQTTYSSYSSTGPKVWLKWVSLVVVFGGFGFLVWYASMNKDNLQTQAMQPELIEPQAGPVKVRAENPGGMEVPNRDKRVFDLLEDPAVKQAEAQENTDVVCEAMGGDIVCNESMPEVAQIKRVSAPETPKPEEKLDLVNEDIGGILAQIEEKEDPAKVEPAPAPVKKVEEKKEDVQVAALHTPAPAVKKELNKVEKPKAAPAQKTEPKTAVSSGQWGVQLASFTTQSDAEKAANGMVKKHSVLQGMQKRIQEATVKGKTYYRVQFFTSEGKTAASQACKTLKSAGQGCFNVKS